MYKVSLGIPSLPLSLVYIHAKSPILPLFLSLSLSLLLSLSPSLSLINSCFLVQHTGLRAPGIYVRNVLSDSPAALCGCIRVGDRILAVNGRSIVGADYLR